MNSEDTIAHLRLVPGAEVPIASALFWHCVERGGESLGVVAWLFSKKSNYSWADSGLIKVVWVSCRLLPLVTVSCSNKGMINWFE